MICFQAPSSISRYNPTTAIFQARAHTRASGCAVLQDQIPRLRHDWFHFPCLFLRPCYSSRRLHVDASLRGWRSHFWSSDGYSVFENVFSDLVRQAVRAKVQEIVRLIRDEDRFLTIDQVAQRLSVSRGGWDLPQRKETKL